MKNNQEHLVAELTNIFLVFNKFFFSNMLVEPVFHVQTKRKFSIRWVVDIKSFVVGSDFVKIKTDEIPDVMLHEMIHAFNSQNNIVDVTLNQYHNKFFVNIALQLGLILIKHKTQGWSITTRSYPRNVTEKLFIKKPKIEKINLRESAFEKLNLNRDSLRISRKYIRDLIKNERPSKNFFLKYECLCQPPHNSVRSGRRPDGPNRLNLVCQDCGASLSCVSSLEDDDY